MPTEAPETSRPWTSRDIWIAAGLLLIALFYLVTHITRGVTPEEDASMLLRYSYNVANGHGIVWNVGEHPVEGATDFLFMLLIGKLAQLFSVGVIAVTRVLLSVSQILSVALLYIFGRRIFKAPVFAATFAAFYLAVGPAFHFVDSCFSAPFYGLVALLTWASVQQMVKDGITTRRAVVFSFLGLTLGLIRPEGNFIAVFMLAAALFGSREGRPCLLATFFAVFAVLGGAYFAWRWHYFGYPLPNPFYVKHQNSIFNTALTLRALLEMLLPTLPFLGLGFINSRGRKALAVLAILSLPFAFIWTFVALDNNGFLRFQYVMVPVILLSVIQTMAIFWDSFEGERISKPVRQGLVGLLAATTLLAVFYVTHIERSLYINPGAYNLAMRLQPLAPKGYTLVTTEAGTLPFFSQWRAIDALALNDEYLAHNKGKFTTEYLDRYKPQLILYKSWQLGPYPAMTPAQQAIADKSFGARVPMVATELRDYAESHGYVLAAVYASQYCEFHYFWVASGGPDSAYILSAVRDHPYPYQESGAATFDFRGSDNTATNTCRARL